MPEPVRRMPVWAPPLLFLCLACIFLWRSTFAGEVFLPARLLGHIAPYRANINGADLPPWNPLRWDGIAQFYPWRLFASQAIHAGYVPLWNPYQFCGTPFVANSQSAVLYPGNLLFYLLPTTIAFGASAILHLTLCGWFTYLLLRRLKCRDMAAILGGVVFAYSWWQVTWLQLPTFLCCSCWIPLLLRQVDILREQAGSGGRLARETVILGAIVGLMLLAGHLQIAFYGLLAGILASIGTAVWLATRRRNGAAAFRLIAGGTCALVLGLMLALPQVLPSLELSRVSHRAGRPTAEGYKAYTEYALPLSNVLSLVAPGFFGQENDPARAYWNFYLASHPGGVVEAVRHNAAETALYVGILPLLLSSMALARVKRRTNLQGLAAAGFGIVALVALLLAIGSGLDALLYFGIPGFGQSGSPARALVLWSLAVAVMTGLGAQSLCESAPSWKEWAIAAGGIMLIALAGLGLVSLSLALPRPHIPTFADALSAEGVGWVKSVILLAISLTLLAPPVWRAISSRLPGGEAGFGAPAAALVIVVLDLFATGITYNPTAAHNDVYPLTPGIQFLQKQAGHERIFPVNQQWSLYQPPPAVLPPNGATVFGLRDVQGYDSLFTGQYKQFANKLARPNRFGFVDASPPEVGNMVFSQNANAPDATYTGAAFAVSVPPASTGFALDALPATNPIYSAEDEMAVYPMAHAHARAEVRDASGAAGAPVTWREDGPTRVAIDLQAAADSTLTLADQFYPGWTATVDDKPVTIQRAPDAPIFRSIPVPSGPHTVRFAYHPASFQAGLFAGLTGIMIVVTVLTAFFQRGVLPARVE